MRRPGICAKCGKLTTVQDHHWKGYSEEHKDDVAPYCKSCDIKAHNKARKEGKCKLSSEETIRNKILKTRSHIFKEGWQNGVRICTVCGKDDHTHYENEIMYARQKYQNST